MPIELALAAGAASLNWGQALFYGIAPGVMAIIRVAAYKLARTTNKKDLKLWAVSGALFMITAVTQTEIAYLFVGAGLFVMLIEAPPAFPFRRLRTPILLAVGHSFLFGAATLATNVSLFLFFLKAGAFIFGSGLAIVPFLRSGVVEQHHWLTEAQFLDAVAMGLITPGPVVITATFIGYLVGGLVGAIVATVGIFTPIYLGVVVPGRWFLRYRDNPHVKAFVRGATAAAAGAIAGAAFVVTRQAVDDIPTVIIALVALVLLLRFRVKEPLIVGLAAVAGLLLY